MVTENQLNIEKANSIPACSAEFVRIMYYWEIRFPW